MALLTSGLTAFYMFRLYFRIFWNKPFEPAHHVTHKTEGGWVMLLPLLVLATGTAVSGFIPFGKYVSTDGNPLESHFHLQFSILPVAAGVSGILLALWLYQKQSNRSEKLALSLKGLYRSAYHKFYIDEIWMFVTKKIIFNLIGRPTAWIDKNIVDGMVNLVGNATTTISGVIRKFQSGRIQQYAFLFLTGAIGLAILFIYLWK